MQNIGNLFPEISKSYLADNFKSLASQRAIEYPSSGVISKDKSKGKLNSDTSVTQIDLTNKTLIELYHE